MRQIVFMTLAEDDLVSCWEIDDAKGILTQLSETSVEGRPAPLAVDIRIAFYMWVDVIYPEFHLTFLTRSAAPWSTNSMALYYKETLVIYLWIGPRGFCSELITTAAPLAFTKWKRGILRVGLIGFQRAMGLIVLRLTCLINK